MLREKLDSKIIEKILQEASEGFLIVDEDLNIIHAMPGALKILELKEFQENTSFKSFLKSADREVNINNISHSAFITARNNDLSAEIVTYELEDGNYLLKLSPINDTECAIIKETRKQKSNFIASLSHDLKTPMQSIMGFSQALLEGITGELPQDQKKYVSIIHKNSNKMMRMINNIIDLCKFESGKLSVNYITFDLKELNDSIEKEVQSLIGNKEILFVIDSDVKIKEIYSDKDRLEQILLSLIDSSIKFTDKGQIKLKFTHPTIEMIKKLNGNRFKELKEESFILISISDSGRGMPEDCGTLFEEKVTNQDKMTREYGSSGLAMVAAHKIVEVLEGGIWLSKNDCDETCFCIILPV